MYKKLGFLFTILTIFCFHSNFTLCDVAKNYDGIFYFYTDYMLNDNDCECISNGSEYIIFTSTKNAKKIQQKLSTIKGYSFTFNGIKEEMYNVLNRLKCEIKKREYVDDKLFIYGYSPYFDDFILNNDEKINIEVCFYKNEINIGVPLILGSA